MPNLRPNRWFFAFIPYKIAFGVSSVLLPLYVVASGGTVADVGLVVAAFLAASIPASIFWAVLSDRNASRKIFILFAFLSTSITFLLFAISRNAAQLLLFSAIQGFLVTAAIPISGMLVIEGAPKGQWEYQIGLFNFIGGIGWSIGLLFGTLSLDARITFMVCMILCAASYLLSFFWIIEPKMTFERESLSIFIPRIDRNFPNVLIHLPTVWERRLFRTLRNGITTNLPRYHLGTLLIFMGATSFFTPMPIFMKSQGLAVSTIFGAFFLNSILAATFYPIVARFSKRWDDRKLLIYSTVARILLFCSAVFTTLLPVAIIPIFLGCIVGLGGLTWAFIAVCGVSLVPKLSMIGKEGSTMGVYNAMSSLGGVGGSLVGSTTAYAFGYEFSFVFAAALLVIGVALFQKVKA